MFLRSRAAIAALLLLSILALPACGGPSGTASVEQNRSESSRGASDGAGSTGGESSRLERATTKPAPEKTAAPEESANPSGGSGKTVEAVLPEDVLSEEEIVKPPKPKDWYADSSDDSPVKVVGSDSSTGAIPAVEPFNFGKDPGGPEDKTLRLTIPKIGLTEVPVFDSVSEEKLTESTVHVPATGFPWQKGANTYIAGHRLGYANTGSFRVFYELDELAKGDEVLLKDSAGEKYRYRVTDTMVVGPDNVEVMNAVPGKSLVTLQTCTLPDYEERIVVQGELVEESV